MQLPNLNFWVYSKQTCYSCNLYNVVYVTIYRKNIIVMGHISQYNGAISPPRPVMVKKNQ